VDLKFVKDLLFKKFQEEEFKDCFLLEIEYSKVSNKLQVFIDCDSGFGFEKCRKISRYLESFLDDKGTLGERYTLEVSSPGLSRPLKLKRQYAKNDGRNVCIQLSEGGIIQGKILGVEEDNLIIEINNVMKKINFEKIKTAKILPSFK